MFVISSLVERERELENALFQCFEYAYITVIYCTTRTRRKMDFSSMEPFDCKYEKKNKSDRKSENSYFLLYYDRRICKQYKPAQW